jgi:hypothetical protein
MKLRLSIGLHIATVGDAVTIRNYFENQISLRQVEVVKPIRSRTMENGTVRAGWVGDFLVRSELQSLYDDVSDKMRNGAIAAAILPGSRVTRHDCRHEEGFGNCRDITLFEDVKS